jgi:two-component system, NarL family, nitrate/nitrite response regulator NarL
VTTAAGTASRRDFRIVVVDDHALFTDALGLTLGIEGYDVRAIALPPEGMSTGELLTTVLAQRPRLVLLDLGLGASGDGVELVGPLASAGIDVVVLTAEPDRGRWGEAVRHGARKVLSKSAPLRESLGVVRRLQQGLAVTTVDEREHLVRLHREHRLQLQERRRRLGLLTQREGGVLGELMEGRAVREIAAAWGVSEATVRTQVKSVLAKLEVSSQLAAVGLARESGWSAPAT